MFRFRGEEALHKRRQVRQGAQQEISARRGTHRGQVAEGRHIFVAVRGELLALLAQDETWNSPTNTKQCQYQTRAHLQ